MAAALSLTGAVALVVAISALAAWLMVRGRGR